MGISIEEKVIGWMIIKKIKGFDIFDFYECARDIGLDYNDDSHIKKINDGLKKFNNEINDFLISLFEENN
jgi:hypothetical protein